MTVGQQNEVQLIFCEKDPSAGGSFTLAFKRHRTAAMSFSVSAAELQAKLQTLRTIGTVTVTYTSGASLCDPAGQNIASIEFTSDFGE